MDLEANLDFHRNENNTMDHTLAHKWVARIMVVRATTKDVSQYPWDVVVRQRIGTNNDGTHITEDYPLMACYETRREARIAADGANRDNWYLDELRGLGFNVRRGTRRLGRRAARRAS